MKRMYVLLLAVLLLLAGCGGKGKTKDISVKNVSCPYEIDHKKDRIEITFHDGAKRGILWDVAVIPEDVCEVTEEKAGKDGVCKYRIRGLTEGAAQLTFTAQLEDQTPVFSLVALVNVDAEGKASISSAVHSERSGASLETEDLDYRWDVDENGILTFSFFDSDDDWNIRSEGEDICMLSDIMATPSGCQFRAQAKADGKTSVLLTGETTQRTIQITLQADSGILDVISVQEQ